MFNIKKYLKELALKQETLTMYGLLEAIKEHSTLLGNLINLEKITDYVEKLPWNNAIENEIDFIQHLIEINSNLLPAINLDTFNPLLNSYRNSILFKLGYRIVNSDVIIGREEEIKLCQIFLNRKYKNNLIILGNPGVGKTAIVSSLSDLIDCDEIIAIEPNKIISNTKYRGEFEEKISSIIDDAIKFKKILFIDEIHSLINCGLSEGGISANNILKPYLLNPDFRLIGATTLEEYKHIVTDKAFERRFNILKLAEPNKKTLKKIIEKNFEDLFLKMDEHSFAEIFLFLDAMHERAYPDKLIDFFDLWHAYNLSERAFQNLDKIKDVFNKNFVDLN